MITIKLINKTNHLQHKQNNKIKLKKKNKTKTKTNNFLKIE